MIYLHPGSFAWSMVIASNIPLMKHRFHSIVQIVSIIVFIIYLLFNFVIFALFGTRFIYVSHDILY